jgi:hypothetical protein
VVSECHIKRKKCAKLTALSSVQWNNALSCSKSETRTTFSVAAKTRQVDGGVAYTVLEVQHVGSTAKQAVCVHPMMSHLSDGQWFGM